MKKYLFSFLIKFFLQFLKNFLFYIGVQLSNNVMKVSSVQQSDLKFFLTFEKRLFKLYIHLKLTQYCKSIIFPFLNSQFFNSSCCFSSNSNLVSISLPSMLHSLKLPSQHVFSAEYFTQISIMATIILYLCLFALLDRTCFQVRCQVLFIFYPPNTSMMLKIYSKM